MSPMFRVPFVGKVPFLFGRKEIERTIPMEKTQKKSLFETPLLSTKVKTADVKLFPETALGYLLGPAFALMANGIVNTYLSQYWVRILGLGQWMNLFPTLLPIISAIIIVIGNLSIGRLIERKPSVAGKARPLILVGMPLIAIALLLLFLVPFPKGATADNPNWLTIIFIAVGYNLYYAFAYPFYYTSHSALVNLSTRDGSKRSLLATASNAAQLVASGIAGMIGPFLVDAIGLLPTGPNNTLADEAAREAANGKWVIIMVIMIAALFIGCLIEYFFTRERITEEKVKLRMANPDNPALQEKKIPMKDQATICVKDKFWWFIIVFYFLYQLGGMLKNNDASWFSQAFTNGAMKLSGTINTVGAVPTALGMLVIWPLARKFGKANCIKVGGIMAFVLGCLGFLVLPFSGNETAVWGISIASFCLKALGTVPAMYISMALLSDVLEHQEALYGKRTDGFTMAVYGSIMVAMPGIANAIINLVNTMPSIVNSVSNQQLANTFLYFGGESLCYLIIAIMFLFMNVEKFSALDKKAILEDQKALALKNNAEWIEPSKRMLKEQAEAEEAIHQEKIALLRKRCETNNAKYDRLIAEGKQTGELKRLDFEEELKKFEADRTLKAEANAKRKAEAQAKKEEQKRLKEEELQARLAAMSPEEKQAYDRKAERKAQKERRVEEEFLALREESAAIRQANLQ